VPFFSSFVGSLERDGLLKVIERPVSPEYEVTQITGGSVEPSLFTDVSGRRVAVNVLGTREMLSRALGIPVDQMARTLAAIQSGGVVNVVDESPSMDVVMEVNLGELPILTHYSGDSGAYITAGIVISEYEGVTNASIHRLMAIGRDKLVARTEGPFVDITGTYDSVREQPVIHINRISHRRDPIYHAILPAGGEHRVLMGVPYEPLIYREASRFAEVTNVVMSDGGCSYLHAVVQITKRSNSEVKDVIEAAFKAHNSLKHVVVVDDDIDILDPSDVEYAIATRVQADHDIHIYTGQRGSSLDPSRKPDGTTTKMGIDATCELDKRGEYLRAVGAVNLQSTNS